MKQHELLLRLNEKYAIKFTGMELLREGGSATYAVYSGSEKYFLKVIGQAFADTLKPSIAVNLYLQNNAFPVTKIIMTKDNHPFVRVGEHYIILYEFLEMTEIDLDKDVEAVGELIGWLHSIMSQYKGELIIHEKWFYVDRYIDILRKKQYLRADQFSEYGERLWERLKDLPRGYSHGDMYSGNIVRGANGKLYILDFDTSCKGFPMYDIALICNCTDYFSYRAEGFSATTAMFHRFLPAYLKHNPLTSNEIKSFYDMLALYHFALQATIIEINGLDCMDERFFDKQLDWLKRWRIQCESEVSMDGKFMNTSNELLLRLEQLHTTELGIERIKRNLSLKTDDVVAWCKQAIEKPNAVITRSGKNWYICIDGCRITVNAHSYTIITAHKEKEGM